MDTKQVKLKKDGTPKQSGGKREKAGRKVKDTPEGFLPWDKQLERALRLAANNMFVVPRSKFFSKREVRDIYGTVAHDQFAEYFVSVLRFDQEKADMIRQKQAEGKFVNPPASWPEDGGGYYTPEKYADWLIDNKCFSWISILKDEHHKAVWKKYADNGRLA